MHVEMRELHKMPLHERDNLLQPIGAMGTFINTLPTIKENWIQKKGYTAMVK